MLNEEQKEIRALARDFAEGELRPHTRTWDEAAAFDPDVLGKLGELGFLGMTVPESHGGLEFDLDTYLVALEEIAWGDAAVALVVAIQNGVVPRLLRGADSEVQEKWLGGLARGDRQVSWAAGGGAVDPNRRPTLRVTKHADGWRADGEEHWAVHGSDADALALPALNEDGEFLVVLVDRTSEGLSVTERQPTMGFRAVSTVSVKLSDVQIPDSHVLASPQKPTTNLSDANVVGRLGMAAIATGIAQAAMEHAIRYADERKQFGQSLSAFGAIRGKLAGMATRVEAARSLTLSVARRHGSQASHGAQDEGALPIDVLAASAKLFASESAAWIADEAVQIFGGYGYMRDYPVEKLMRDAKGTEIFEGTSELQRLVIGSAAAAQAHSEE